MKRHFYCLPLFGVVFLATCRIVQAQTGPELLLKPWPKEEQIQTEGSWAIVNSGSTDTGEKLDLSFVDFSGRVRLRPESRADPRFGFNETYIHIGGTSGLPSSLCDTSVALGMGIADWNGWLAGITVGVGYAGAGGYDDGNAWYGMGDFLVGRKFDDANSLGFVINYDGNRSFMPDTPLPGVLYTRRLFPPILLGIGFPFNSIEYKPNDRLTLTGELYVPDMLRARVDYALARRLGVFAEYQSRQDAFHWDALDNVHDRLLYDARRAEVGMRWTFHDMLSLVIAGGYTFSQEFNVGFDTREQDRLVKPDDEAYVRVGMEFRR